MGLDNIRILADYSIRGLRNVIVGANEIDTHFMNANWDRDFTIDTFADLRQAQAGDHSPSGSSPLQTARGIEVGHVFMLGKKYSEQMNATYRDAQGTEHFTIMGCYGIGVGRSAAAAIEQNHDEKGIIWPIPIAPFHVHLLPVTPSQQVMETTETVYAELIQAGVEVLLDDRDERAGVKFNDADLIGAPFQVVIGDKGLAKETIDLKERRTKHHNKVVPPATCS